MAKYIDKSAVVAEIEKRIKEHHSGYLVCLKDILSFLDTLEVKDPYEQYVQYVPIKAGIQDYAETYSFNIESILFNQLTKEQQALWRKETERVAFFLFPDSNAAASWPRWNERPYAGIFQASCTFGRTPC